MLARKLNGDWDGWVDESVSERFWQPDFAESPDYSLAVPGHWQQLPALSRHQGSVFYRRTFDLEADYERFTWRLRFQGAFYITTVWVNGKLVGQHEGYFQPFLWEIETGLLRERQNVIAVRLDCPPAGKDWRDTVLGAFGTWDSKPEWVNPGGIWGDVQLIGSHGGFFQDLSTESRLTAWNAAQIKISGQLQWRGAADDLSAQLTVAPRNFSGKSLTQQYDLEVLPGTNELSLKFSLPDPKLWWTWDLGQQNLYDLELVLTDAEGRIVDRYGTYLGFRTIKWERWQLTLNGRRLFLRGSNYTPASFYPASLTAEQLQQDASLMVGANLNFVRVHAHVAHPEFYRACAERGILMWQDFPLDKRYDHHIIETAIAQIRQMVSLLAKEPAIAFWACHNEPYVLPLEERKQEATSRVWGTTVRSSRPSWNKDVLDTRLKAAVQQIDPHRPVFPYSGVFGFVRGGSDTHQYFGWNTPNYRTLQTLGRFFPQTMRLVSEYGAQSWPLDDRLLEEAAQLSAWPNLPWELVRRRYLLDYKQLHEHVNPADYPSIAEYALATQVYQAELLQFYHETLRLRRFHPCAGAIMFSFSDAWPIVSWSMLDWQRRPKLAYSVTARAMRPVQVMVDWPKREYRAGENWSSRIYVVNDLHRPMPAMGLHWRLISPAGDVVASERRIADAERDQVTEVGLLRIRFPEDSEGEFRLELSLELPNRDRIENSYRLRVVF